MGQLWDSCFRDIAIGSKYKKGRVGGSAFLMSDVLILTEAKGFAHYRPTTVPQWFTAAPQDAPRHPQALHATGYILFLALLSVW